jgi:hypothetical protein
MKNICFLSILKQNKVVREKRTTGKQFKSTMLPRDGQSYFHKQCNAALSNDKREL